MKNNFDNNVYANEEEFVDFTNERKKCTVMSIKSNSKDITKDTVMLAVNAFSVGVGALGTIVFSKRLIEFCNEKSKFSLNKGTSAIIRAVPVVLSGAQVLLGVKGIVNKKKDLQKDLTYRKTLVKKLEKYNKEHIDDTV